MRKYFVPVLGGIIVLALCLIEGLTDFFISLDYVFVGILCLVIAGIFFLCGAVFAMKKRQSILVVSTVLVSVVLVAFALGAPKLSTSPRKKFYVLAHQVKVGEPLNSAKLRMKGFESWTTDDSQTGAHYLSFRFTSGPGTTDSVAIRYDPKSLRVVGVNYSSD